MQEEKKVSAKKHRQLKEQVRKAVLTLAQTELLSDISLAQKLRHQVSLNEIHIPFSGEDANTTKTFLKGGQGKFQVKAGDSTTGLVKDSSSGNKLDDSKNPDNTMDSAGKPNKRNNKSVRARRSNTKIDPADQIAPSRSKSRSNSSPGGIKPGSNSPPGGTKANLDNTRAPGQKTNDLNKRKSKTGKSEPSSSKRDYKNAGSTAGSSADNKSGASRPATDTNSMQTLASKSAVAGGKSNKKANSTNTAGKDDNNKDENQLNPRKSRNAVFDETKGKGSSKGGKNKMDANDGERSTEGDTARNPAAQVSASDSTIDFTSAKQNFKNDGKLDNMDSSTPTQSGGHGGNNKADTQLPNESKKASVDEKKNNGKGPFKPGKNQTQANGGDSGARRKNKDRNQSLAAHTAEVSNSATDVTSASTSTTAKERNKKKPPTPNNTKSHADYGGTVDQSIAPPNNQAQASQMKNKNKVSPAGAKGTHDKSGDSTPYKTNSKFIGTSHPTRPKAPVEEEIPPSPTMARSKLVQRDWENSKPNLPNGTDTNSQSKSGEEDNGTSNELKRGPDDKSKTNQGKTGLDGM